MDGRIAQLSKKSYPQLRVTVVEFLDTTIFDLSNDNCIAFFDPLIDSWNIDLTNFCIEIVLNRRVAPGHHKTFEFMERGPDKTSGEEPELKESLRMMRRRIGTWLFCQHMSQQQSHTPCDRIREQKQFHCHLAPKITPLIHDSLPLSINRPRTCVDDRRYDDRSRETRGPDNPS
jgi:hypothetical protein